MSSTPIAVTAGRARERLAASLAALQQDPNVPAAVMDIVQGIARAIGPLFQLEKGGDPALVFQARAALQETLGRMQQGADQGNAAVADATAAIAQSLGMLFAAVREHGLTDPATAPTAAIPVVQPIAPVQPAPPPQPAATPTLQATPATAVAPIVSAAPAYEPPPVPLIQPAPQPVPLVQPAPQPMPLTTAAKGGARRSKAPTMFPETAARPQAGASGLPRLEAELGVHSESNFYTNFLGDISDHGGIFVATWGAVAIGTQCEVELQFPGDLRADVRGVVRWRRESGSDDDSLSPGLGVEITHADGEAWSLIKRFIGKRDPIIHDV